MKIFIQNLFSIILLFNIVLGIEQLKVTLNSGKVYNNCEFENLLGDTLRISLLTEENSDIIILAKNIKSIIKTDGSSINKYDFTIIPVANKVATLNEIFTQTNSKTPTAILPISESQSNSLWELVLFIIVISFLLITAVSVLFKKRKKPEGEEKIPGAKEMVETMMMWARKNREERSKE